MIYVGIDLRKEFLQLAAIYEKGKRLLNERVRNDHTSVKKILCAISSR